MSTPLIKALILYLLVCEIVTPDPNSKNNFPILPKTSPASIAQTIANVGDGSAQTALNRLANQANLEVVAARNFCFNVLRSKEDLVGPPGNLPTNEPQPGDVPFSREQETGMLLSLLPNFYQTWTGSFTLANAVNAANHHGFDMAAPFFCAWADMVNSTIPASAVALPTLIGGLSNEIKMAFESRIGRGIMNIGFSPYIEDLIWRRSYLSIVKLLGDPADVQAVEKILNTVPAFNHRPDVKQNFKNGPH